LFIGDKVAEDALVPPYSCVKNYDEGRKAAEGVVGAALDPVSPQGESILTREYLERIRTSPTSFVGRVFVNLATFWYLGESGLKSSVLGILLIPIALLGLLGSPRVWGGDIRLRPVVMLVLYYWTLHGMILGFGRYAVPLVPTFILLAGFGVSRRSSRSLPDEVPPFVGGT
jgi:hypothetical protein